MPKKTVTKAKPKRVSSSWTDSLRHPVGFYKSLSRWYRVLVWVCVFLVAYMFITGLRSIYYQYSVEKKFTLLDSDISSVRSEIFNKLPGSELSYEKTCARYSVKFGEGDLYCQISLASIEDYNSNKGGFTETELSTIKEILSDVFGNKLLENDKQDMSISYAKIQGSEIGCSIDIHRKTFDGSRKYFKLNCSAPSKRAFY